MSDRPGADSQDGERPAYPDEDTAGRGDGGTGSTGSSGLQVSVEPPGAGRDPGNEGDGRRTDRVVALEQRIDRLESAIRAVEHDVRGALVVGDSHLEAARTEPSADHFDGIAHAHGRIESLLGELTTVADVGTTGSDRAAVALAEVAHQAWAGIATSTATLRVAHDVRVVADRQRLLRLLENLLRNAVEHGGTGSVVGDGSGHRTVVLPVEAGDGRSPSSTTRRAGVTVTVGALDEEGFYVADDGPGIPEADRERIFEEGYTTSETGTGLGLAIVQEVVRDHGWTIRVGDSAVDGARFEIADVETLD